MTGKKFGPSVQQSFDEPSMQASQKSRSKGFVGRWWRHTSFAGLRCDKAFNADVFQAIEQSITASEEKHTCEIRFVVESDLSVRELYKGVSPRQRALELFGALGVWDTELNNGILIYVLFADRAVEVIADRAVVDAVSKDCLARVARTLTDGFKRNEFRLATVAAIQSLSDDLQKAFSVQSELTKAASNPNELSNRPTRL